VLDPERTAIEWRTRSMGLIPVRGTATAVSGEARITPGGSATGTLRIDAASIATGNKRRDEHLRSKHFLDVAAAPMIVFAAVDASPSASTAIDIDGTLTIRAETRALVVHADIRESGDSVTLSTDVEIDRRLWNMRWGTKLGIGCNTRVRIHAQFDRVS
jgi:polyisoprenoid-binding protein YceI